MQLETKEPAHGTFPSLGNSLEHLVDVYPLISADAKRSAVDKADARTLAQKYLLNEQGQGYGDLLLDLNETRV